MYFLLWLWPLILTLVTCDFEFCDLWPLFTFDLYLWPFDFGPLWPLTIVYCEIWSWPLTFFYLWTFDLWHFLLLTFVTFNLCVLLTLVLTFNLWPWPLWPLAIVYFDLCVLLTLTLDLLTFDLFYLWLLTFFYLWPLTFDLKLVPWHFTVWCCVTVLLLFQCWFSNIYRYIAVLDMIHIRHNGNNVLTSTFCHSLSDAVLQGWVLAVVTVFVIFLNDLQIGT